MGCPKCGKPGFSVETNADKETKAAMLCREHWGETQNRRIDQLFDMIESSPNIQHAIFDSDWHYPSNEIAPLDPGMTKGRKRRVVHKSEPMAG